MTWNKIVGESSVVFAAVEPFFRLPRTSAHFNWLMYLVSSHPITYHIQIVLCTHVWANFNWDIRRNLRFNHKDGSKMVMGSIIERNCGRSTPSRQPLTLFCLEV